MGHEPDTESLVWAGWQGVGTSGGQWPAGQRRGLGGWAASPRALAEDGPIWPARDDARESLCGRPCSGCVTWAVGCVCSEDVTPTHTSFFHLQMSLQMFCGAPQVDLCHIWAPWHVGGGE